MATRRDRDLAPHPGVSPQGRPTQIATEILTDQDFVITSPEDGDFLRYNGSSWVNISGIPFTDLTGNIASGQVPEVVVTQHEAALSIGASQVTAGTFGSGSYVFPGEATLQGRLNVAAASTVLARLTNTDNTDQSWDLRVSGSGNFELRAITDSGSTVQRAFFVSHASGQVTFDAGINEGAVTEHEAALSIGASQITAGTFGSGNYTFPAQLSVAGDLHLQNTTPQLIFDETDAATQERRWRIIASGGSLFFQGREDPGETFANPTFMAVRRTGITLDSVDFIAAPVHLIDGSTSAPALAFISDEDTGFYLTGATDGIGVTLNGSLRASFGTIPKLFPSADEALRLVHSNANGEPYLSFYQDTDRRGYIQWNDSERDLRLVAEEVNSEIRLYGADSLVARFNYGNAGGVRIQGTGDDLIDLWHTNSDGNPRINFRQDGTFRARLAYENSSDIFRITNNTVSVTLRTNGNLEAVDGDVIANV